MYCPTCQEVQLMMTDRQGIEIDYCPQCRGVWLDRGELDKLIERATQPYQPAQRPQQPAPPPTPVQPPPGYNQPQGYTQPQNYNQSPGYNQHQNYNQHHGHYKKKKRESFLDDLFDFD